MDGVYPSAEGGGACLVQLNNPTLKLENIYRTETYTTTSVVGPSLMIIPGMQIINQAKRQFHKFVNF